MMRRRFHSFNDWLFFEGTRGVQLMSAVMFIGLSLLVLIDAHNDKQMIKQPLYSFFASVPTIWIFLPAFIIGIVQLVVLNLPTLRSDLAGGCLLLWSGLGWFLIGMAFSTTYPPGALSMVFFPLLGIMCVLAGIYLLRKTNLADKKDVRGR